MHTPFARYYPWRCGVTFSNTNGVVLNLAPFVGGGGVTFSTIGGCGFTFSTIGGCGFTFSTIGLAESRVCLHAKQQGWWVWSESDWSQPSGHV